MPRRQPTAPAAKCNGVGKRNAVTAEFGYHGQEPTAAEITKEQRHGSPHVEGRRPYHRGTDPRLDRPIAARITDSPTGLESSVHLALGNPSGATNDLRQSDNYLLQKPQYALSYNNAAGTPNWVAWRLGIIADIGPAPRGAILPRPGFAAIL